MMIDLIAEDEEETSEVVEVDVGVVMMDLMIVIVLDTEVVVLDEVVEIKTIVLIEAEEWVVTVLQAMVKERNQKTDLKVGAEEEILEEEDVVVVDLDMMMW